MVSLYLAFVASMLNASKHFELNINALIWITVVGGAFVFIGAGLILFMGSTYLHRLDEAELRAKIAEKMIEPATSEESVSSQAAPVDLNKLRDQPLSKDNTTEEAFSQKDKLILSFIAGTFVGTVIGKIFR